MSTLPKKSFKQSEQGFTLLEVIMTIVILVSLSGGATFAIRNSLDIRRAMGERTAVSHKMNVVMQKLTKDLEHVYIISTLSTWSNPVGRATKTLFENTSKNIIRMTTMSKKPFRENSEESDETFVVYELKDDKDLPGWKSLYRGETKVIPIDLNEDVPMEKLAQGIKTFEIHDWTGEKWEETNWSTNKTEHRNMLPRMVRIKVEAIEVSPEFVEEGTEVSELPTATYATVVYIPRSWGLKEYKPFSGSLKWN